MTEAEHDPERGRAGGPGGRVSRRGLLTEELGKAGVEVARRLPNFAPLLGFAAGLKPRPPGATQRDAALVRELWELLLERAPKPPEKEASLDVLRGARSPEEKGDALADVLWALCHTAEFEDLRRPDDALVRGLYRVALRREPTAEEEVAAVEILAETTEPADRGSALEGLFTGLIRSPESVLRGGSADL